MLRIIDRYLLGEFVRPLLFGIGIFAALVVGTVLLSDVLHTLQRYNLSVWLILKYLALSSPEYLTLCVPMGALLGTLLAVGRMSTDHEIVALRAAGLDLYRLVLPLLALGVFLAGGTMLMSELAVPRARTALVQMKNDLNSGRYGGKRERVTIPIMEGGALRWVLVAGSLEGSDLDDVFLFYFDPHEEQRPEFLRDFELRARHAHWANGRWEFQDMHEWQIRLGAKGYELVRLKSQEVQIPDFEISPRELQARHLTPEDVSGSQLKGVIDDLDQQDVTDNIDPTSLDALEHLAHEIRESVVSPVNGKRTLSFYDHGQLAWVVVYTDVNGAELHNLRLFHYDADHPESEFVAYAQRAVWDEREGWTFYKLRKARMQPEEGNEPLGEELAEGRIPEFKLSPRELELHAEAMENWSIAQLESRIGQIQFSDEPVDKRELRDLRTSLYFKYSIPLTPVFFVWIGFPLAILPQRASNTRGMGIALLIILLYMASVALLRSMGAAGALPPMLAAWTPNLALALAGWRLMVRRQYS